MKKHLLLLLLIYPLFAEDEVPPDIESEEWEVRYKLPTRKEIQEDAIYEYESPLDVFEEKKELSVKEMLAYYFGTFVTTSPYPGVRATFFGTELMSELSNVNKDLQILIELERYKQFLKERGLPYFRHPRLFLSGLVDGFGFVGKSANGNVFSDIDLGSVEIGFMLTVNPWLNSIFILQYDNSQINLFGDRVNNSRVQVETGILMFGDLDASPFYATLGQAFIPFGQYSTYAAVQLPLTRLLFRTLGREAAVGFYNGTIQASAYAFKGGTFQDKGQNINNYGFTGSYIVEKEWFEGKFTGGFIRNVADSQLQLVAFSPLIGPNLKHVVPGVFAGTNISIGPIRLLSEYFTAIKSFSPQDMAFSTNRGRTFSGARVSALNAEIAYIFKIFNRESSLSYGYSETWEALGFALPKRRMLLTSTTNVAKGALLSFEIGYNKLYDSRDRAAGKIILGSPVFLTTANLGKSDYSLGIDFLLYW